MTIKTGDTVKHLPTGETWVVTSMREDGVELAAFGWPETIAYTSDCKLVESCTDEDRVSMLQAAAKSGSLRGLWAKRELLNRNESGVKVE